jgi:hypothetical protein
MTRPPLGSTWESDTPQAISLQNMRVGVGWLAILLPLLTGVGYAVLGAGRGGFLDSISESYYTLVRDAFVGTLCMEALFLFAYRGYNGFEDVFFNCLGVLCVLIALFSMNPEVGSPGGIPAALTDSCSDVPVGASSVLLLNNRTFLWHRVAFGYVHLGAAALLFISLGWVSFFWFTKSVPIGPRRIEKVRRNRIYRACGIAIWSSLGLYGAFQLALNMSRAPWLLALSAWPVLFWVETVCLFAFGFSWLLKGDGVYGLADKPAPP